VTELIRTQKSHGNRYGYAETERGLLELAMSNGNAKQAARALASDAAAGFEISPQTLLRWRRKDERRYEQIRSEIRPRLMEKASEDHLRVAQAATKVVSAMTERMAKEIDSIPIRDLPGSARNMATTAGIHFDKAQLAAGQPTAVVMRDATEVLRELEALGYRPELIEGTVSSEEVVDGGGGGESGSQPVGDAFGSGGSFERRGSSCGSIPERPAGFATSSSGYEPEPVSIGTPTRLPHSVHDPS